MFRLDGIKRQAHQHAWYTNDNDPPSNFPLKNPFTKRNPHRTSSRPGNELDRAETGRGNGTALKPVQTARDELRPSVERRRQVNPVPHSATEPNARSSFTQDDARKEKMEIPRSDSPVDEVSEVKQAESNGAQAHDSKSSDETQVENYAAANDKSPIDIDNETTALQRPGAMGRMRGLFHKKPKNSDDDNDNGKKKPKKHFTPMSQVRGTILNSWINVLLICSPIGIALYYAKVNPIVVFVVNFIAIIPLAGMLSYATEEIALRTGETIGGLLNASFGNAVELIVSIIALVDGQILIVQTSLIGSILSNLLLVMGMCFFFGGFNRVEQAFNITVAQTASSLLFLAVSSLILPTAFHSFSGAGNEGISQISRATAILLLLVYACYIFFQLKTHAAMYSAPSEKNEKKDMAGAKKAGRRVKEITKGNFRKKSVTAMSTTGSVDNLDSPIGSRDGQSENNQREEQQEQEPQLSITTAVLTLAGSTVLVALNAEYLVDSINAITCTGGLSKNFVGLILLPIVGNAAEHATAVTVAVKDKMDLAIGVAVGSSMQIALLVLPLTVVLGWIIGGDKAGSMTLYFDGFQIAILFVAVLLVNYLIQDGKSHWLEGVLLQTLYIIIAVAAWYVMLPLRLMDRFANLPTGSTPQRRDKTHVNHERLFIRFELLLLYYQRKLRPIFFDFSGVD